VVYVVNTARASL